jgi:hypothetical protein
MPALVEERLENSIADGRRAARRLRERPPDPTATEDENPGSRETFAPQVTPLGGSKWNDLRHGNAALGDHDLVTRLDLAEILAEAGLQLTDCGFHVTYLVL